MTAEDREVEFVDALPPITDPEAQQLYEARLAGHEAMHRVVTSLAEIRKAASLTQVQVAESWGRPQSNVSRLESNPAAAELRTLAGYVAALGGRLRLVVEIGDETLDVDLIDA